MQKNTRQCISCKQILPLSKFRKYKNVSGFGYRRYCRECESKADKVRRQKKEVQSVDNPFRLTDFYRKVKGR